MKALAFYNPTQGDVIEIGRPASLPGGGNHHRLGAVRWFITTKVTSILKDGFETKNTHYIRK